MNFYYKYKKQILYLFFGGLTTLTNILTYYIFYDILNFGNVISNIIGWIIAVLFAYLTNRKYVFESKRKGFKRIAIESIYFFGCRLATGALDIIIMYISVDILNLNNIICKLTSNIIVIILNYIISKLYIFKK